MTENTECVTEAVGDTTSEKIEKPQKPQKPQKLTDIQVRVRTSIIYTAVSIICLLVSDITTVILLAATAGFAVGEFYYMLRADAKLPNELLGIIAAVLYPVSMWLWGLTGTTLVSLALLMALIVWYTFWSRSRVPDVGVSFFGAAYTGLLLSALVLVRVSIPGFWGGVLVLGIFLGVWANDAFAYLVGCKFGKHKMAPRTSPKKSWEGFFAGLVGSVLIWSLMTFIPYVDISLPWAIFCGLLCGLMGVLGDLAESRIKRNMGFKDSGTLLPGHGGVLDRTDSMFLVSVTSTVLLIGGGCIPYVF